jgi:glycosyltransferase involved in cell wall biosynthesis
MDWAPNEDAIDWYSREVLPLIRSEYPDVVTWAVGRNPPASLRALGRAIPNLHITGRVDDIRPYLDRACVYITPMRSGSGTRLKIFEAMASGKAIVSTSIGAEGLPVQHEKNILLAETPQDFARQCVRLLRDPDLRHSFGSAARRLVEEKYSWARVVDDFEEIVRSAVERCRRMPQAAVAS